MGLHRTAFSPLRYAKTAVYAGVSWIDVVLFWWFGASGLGPELVAKPVFFSCAKAVEIGGQLVAQLFKSGDGKLGVPFMGPSAASWVLIC